MSCRSFAKPVSGDGKGDAAAVVGVAAGGLLETLGPAPQAEKNKANATRGPVLLIAGLSQTFFSLLIPNIHDRALRILINDIKPTAQPCMLEKIVMLIV